MTREELKVTGFSSSKLKSSSKSKSSCAWARLIIDIKKKTLLIIVFMAMFL
jgi:hypothetical protein